MIASELESLCSEAHSEIVLVAPFVKYGTLKHLFTFIRENAAVSVVTRWWPQDIAAGVSDLEVWSLIDSRDAARLYLRDDLHAKFYRGDQRCLVGSANLTNRALGLSPTPNLELLIEVAGADAGLVEFERTLFESVVEVDQEVYDATRELVAMLPADPVAVSVDAMPASTLVDWLPGTRHPSDLYAAYCGDSEALSAGALDAAVGDLAALSLPPGLARDGFAIAVAATLLRTPALAAIDEFIGDGTRRFGEMRDFVAEHFEVEDASRVWQTWFRWINCFLPDRYDYLRPRHSELIRRRAKSPMHTSDSGG